MQQNVQGRILACLLSSALLGSYGNQSNVQAAEGKPQAPVSVVYPKAGAEIDCASTFLVGAATANHKIFCNGLPVKTNRDGFFGHVVALKPGTNTFILTEEDATDAAKGLSTSVTVRRPQAQPVLSGALPKFAKDSLEPKEDLGVTAGDLIGFAVRAQAKSKVTVELANHKIILREQSAGTSVRPVNRGLDAAFGITLHWWGQNRPDYYIGYYQVSAHDHFSQIHPRFVCEKSGKKIQLPAPCRISTVDQPVPAYTAHDETVVRLGPGQARTTPMPSGVAYLIDGWQGNSMRALLSNNHHVWIAKEDLVLNDQTGQIPHSVVRTVNLEADAYGDRIVVPLNQRLPYKIQQAAGGRLSLSIYGATSDTDWICPAETQRPTHMIDQVVWNQAEDKVYELKVKLKSNNQWGYYGSYEGTNLVLHIKSPPKMEASETNDASRLKGVSICLDPGHGGQETGAIGPSGIHESAINLGIAIKLAHLLEAKGARVIMTRLREDQDVSLADRVKTAVTSKADLLISVHNNALPDGRDPWSARGTSAYWYQPQSQALARQLQKSTVSGLGFPDFGVFYDNLALARPSQLLACLIEVGFMINPDEYSELIRPEIQEKAAEAIERGIEKYLLETGSKGT
jgi:N-acetylmuramoyl-L-alanine amidase